MAIMHCVASWGVMLSLVTTGRFLSHCTSWWSREHTRPADVLVPNFLGKPAAFDLSVTSTLNAQSFQEACVTAGSAALAAQIRKHRVNDEMCRELGWVCIPLVVETYGCWGTDRGYSSTIETCHQCVH